MRSLLSWINKNAFVFWLLVLTVLAYGLFSRKMGFYADEWYIIWFLKTFGAGQFNQFFAQDRPFLAISYTLFTSLLGSDPFTWQIFGVLTHFLSALAFWFMLAQAWPENKPLQRWATALFLIFPGFSEQWMSVMYSQVFLLLAGYLVTIGLTIYVFRNPKRWLLITLPSLLWMSYALFSVEYFLGLEVFRLLLVLKEAQMGALTTSERLKRAAQAWLPFAFATLAFLIWRVFFWKSYMYEIQPLDTLFASGGVAGFAIGILRMLADTLLFVWGIPLKLVELPTISPVTWRIWAMLPLVGVVTWFFRRALQGWNSEGSPGKENQQQLQIMLIGFLMVLGSLVPFKAAGLPISIAPPYDRFMIIFGLGSALFITGLVFLLFKRSFAPTILGLLICLSVATQVSYAYNYQRLTTQQRDFLWQLTWRAPNLAPGTMLLTDNLPFGFYFSDMSLSGALNLIYTAPTLDRQMSYMILYSSAHLGSELKKLELDEPVTIAERSFQMVGNTSKSVGFYYSPDACLVVLEPALFPSTIHPHDRNQVDLMYIARISHPELIQTEFNPITPPEIYFGSEPAHGWCYYFQKADLERQRGNWGETIRLLEAAQAEGYQPNNHMEWFPFVIAYTNLGEWQKAEQIVSNLFQGQPDQRVLQCNVWSQLTELSSANLIKDENYLAIQRLLECGK